jgi:hypothetical protein
VVVVVVGHIPVLVVGLFIIVVHYTVVGIVPTCF